MAKNLKQKNLKDVNGGLNLVTFTAPTEHGYWYVLYYSIKYRTSETRSGFDTEAIRDATLQAAIQSAQAQGAHSISYQIGYTE